MTILNLKKYLEDFKSMLNNKSVILANLFTFASKIDKSQFVNINHLGHFGTSLPEARSIT